MTDREQGEGGKGGREGKHPAEAAGLTMLVEAAGTKGTSALTTTEILAVLLPAIKWSLDSVHAVKPSCSPQVILVGLH